MKQMGDPTKNDRRILSQPALSSASVVLGKASKALSTQGAQPVVFGREDVVDAQRYAPMWEDLLRFEAPPAIVTALHTRGMRVQGFADAIGALNLDLYPVRVTTLPIINGTRVDAPGLLRHIRLNFNRFIDTDNSEFLPYTPGTDDVTWASSSPLGTVFRIDIVGPYNAAVVNTLMENHRWRFTTIYTPNTGTHPVSGHREWGFRKTATGELHFYTRGADRSTQAPETMFDVLTFRGGDALWRSFQRKVAEFINTNGGSAVSLDRFSRRFNWTVVRTLLGLRDRTI
jgi:hypothetical protein